MFKNIITDFINSDHFVTILVELIINLAKVVGVKPDLIDTIAQKFCDYTGD